MFFWNSLRNTGTNLFYRFEMKRIFLEDMFPICVSGEGYVINLAGMLKYSPTGNNWGYAPFAMVYKDRKEAEKVRKEIWETIKRWVVNYG